MTCSSAEWHASIRKLTFSKYGMFFIVKYQIYKKVQALSSIPVMVDFIFKFLW